MMIMGDWNMFCLKFKVVVFFLKIYFIYKLSCGKFGKLFMNREKSI